MFGFRTRRDDLDFMPDVEAAARRSANRFAFLLTIFVFVAVGTLLAWAAQAMLDEVTRGEGRVVPSSRTQVIQNLEGGILAGINVREGDIVARGSLLLRIENKAAETSYREARSRSLSLLAGIARAEAELAERPIVFPDSVLKDAPATAADQRALLRARRQQLDAEINVATAQAAQRRQEIAELNSRRKQLAKTLAITREEYDISRPLVAKGVLSRVSLLRLERDMSKMEGEFNSVRLSIPRAQSAMREAEERIRGTRLAFRNQATESLNRLRSELQPLVETMIAGKDRVRRTEVRSPVRGTVKDIMMNTIGGVIRPGENIMEIVPLDDTLLIEARIRPSDIAFLRPKQAAAIKITAYDYSIYGGLDATVERISADTIEDERGERFYRVYLRTAKNVLVRDGIQLPIIPGMTASVDILTGEKSVLDYLLKPILKARERALHER
ncbi:MAG: HlyD family type I secretion periplasmic adaptor subunit [Alphaproteobacteria bacterium]